MKVHNNLWQCSPTDRSTVASLVFDDDSRDKRLIDILVRTLTSVPFSVPSLETVSSSSISETHSPLSSTDPHATWARYVAPEMVTLGGGAVGPAADVFALAALCFELVTRKTLLPTSNNIVRYRNLLDQLPGVPLSEVRRLNSGTDWLERARAIGES